MTPVHTFELVVLMMAVVVPLEMLARRLHLPPAAALILGGMGMALIPGRHELSLDPDLVLVLFLPPLLMSGAWFTVWRDFRANLGTILQLAVGAVAFTTLVVGVAAHLAMPTLPWAVCFALGAIVSPPDAVAAKAVLQGVKLPPRMIVLLEGESLVNDASGLVLFRLAVAAALTGSFSVAQAASGFAVLSVGGVVAGAALGWVASHLLSRLDTQAAIVTSLIVTWASYIGGEAIGVSGVLATVSCGLVLGQRQHAAFSATSRISAASVWGIVTFILESLIFVMIGLSLRGVLERLGGTWSAGLPLLPAMLAVVASVVLSRFAWIVPAIYLRRLLSPRLRAAGPAPPIAIPIVMSWAGMRGVVSLAAALSLPESMPGRDFVLAATFLVILVTVLVQGSTLGPLIRLLKVDRITLRQRTTLSEFGARARMWEAQLNAVRRMAVAPDGAVLHPRLLEQYEYRATVGRSFQDVADDDVHPQRTAHFDVVLTAIEAGRSTLLALYRDGEVHEAVLGTLERELDLEELTARRHRGPDA